MQVCPWVGKPTRQWTQGGQTLHEGWHHAALCVHCEVLVEVHEERFPEAQEGAHALSDRGREEGWCVEVLRN